MQPRHGLEIGSRLIVCEAQLVEQSIALNLGPLTFSDAVRR
jgi:hypothetical protein